MLERSLYPELMGTSSLLRMLPTAAEVEDLKAVFCRKGLWKEADRTVCDTGGDTSMAVEFWNCVIAAFEQRGQARRQARHVLGIACTGYSRTWVSAEVERGRDAEEKVEHRDIGGEVHETLQSSPMSHLGWLVESQNHRIVGVGRDIWTSSNPTAVLKHIPLMRSNWKASRWVFSIC